MAPQDPIQNPPNLRWANTKTPPNLRMGEVALEFPNRDNVLLGELRSGVLRPGAWSHAAFGERVACVIPHRAQKEMVWPHARGVVTVMADHKTGQNWPVLKLPDQPVHKDRAPRASPEVHHAP